MVNKNIVIENISINVVLKEEYNPLKKYIPIFLNDGDAIEKLNLDLNNNYIYFLLTPKNRLASYTPFFAKAIDKKFDDFLGEGCKYNEILTKKIIPELIKEYNLDIENIIYGGISLGGLQVIYTSFLSNPFKYYFSICGSFWYPNFIEFINDKKIQNQNVKIYLLNGKNEGVQHNNILNNAYNDALKVHSIIKEKIRKNNCFSYFDEYGHHQNIKKRLEFILDRITEDIYSNN